MVGFRTDSYLMLDVDLKRAEKVVEWAEQYAEAYDLGSVLIMRTSSSKQIDLFDNELDNFCIIFGQPLPWQEIRLHVEHAYEDEIVNRQFRDMRYLGHITERVNRKNSGKDHPRVYTYFPNGNNEGCMEYLRWWKWNREVGYIGR